MKIGDKIKINFFGFPLLRVKKKEENYHCIYLFGIPILSCKRHLNRLTINIPFIQNIFNRVEQEKIDRVNLRKKQEILDKFNRGEKLTLCFMTARPGMCPFDYLYKLFSRDPRFCVYLVVMPDVRWGRDAMIKTLNETVAQLRAKGYSPILGYNAQTDSILNLRNELNPDIIFFSDFWKPHFADAYYISNFRDKITFLVDYGYSVVFDEYVCNWELCNLVDMYFRPGDIHVQMSRAVMDNKGVNVVAVGAPKLDALSDDTWRPKDVWKVQDKPKKRIIWAPHHEDKSSGSMWQNDGFWYLHDFMLRSADEMKDEIQIVFRPHPCLFAKIAAKWGEKKAREYYEKWDGLSNGQVYMGEFMDLFATSDAMILDSMSFMAEYTAFDKPLFHTVTKTSRNSFNKFGEMLYRHLYKTENDLETDIVKFIRDVVIGGNDYLQEGRHKFAESYFRKINGKTASENIYDKIIEYLTTQTLTLPPRRRCGAR